VKDCADKFHNKHMTKGMLLSCGESPDSVDPASLLAQISQGIGGDLNPKMTSTMQKLVCAHAITYGMMCMLRDG
ncbi:hypothetical protein IT409_01750, partial [Candidatus Falkowbacteria bacterium]|nr:hypothetical protein [Candidatus Falkowbacteria bacterium]